MEDEHLDHSGHLPRQAEATEELEEATYLGLPSLANFGGAVAVAIGMYRKLR